MPEPTNDNILIKNSREVHEKCVEDEVQVDL